MAAEVFISYASQNRDRILDLVERLRGAGVSVWIDQMGIEGAAMWSQQIVAAIRDCKVLILAISKKLRHLRECRQGTGPCLRGAQTHPAGVHRGG